MFNERFLGIPVTRFLLNLIYLFIKQTLNKPPSELKFIAQHSEFGIRLKVKKKKKAKSIIIKKEKDK